MGTSLAEYKDLITDVLKSGIAETIITVNPGISYLPFKNIAGTTWKYKCELAEPTVPFHEVDGTWTSQQPTWEDRYADLVILGDDVDVDKFAIATAGAQEDVEAGMVSLKAKALSNTFWKNFVMGRTTSDTTNYNSSKNFKGLLRLIAELESTTTTDLDGVNNSQVYAANAASVALTIDNMDALVAKVKPKATDIMMNTDTRNKLNSLARAAGNNLQIGKGLLGEDVEMYGTYRIVINDFILTNVQDASSSVLAIASYDPTTTRASGYDNTVIFAYRMGEDGLTGITAAGAPMIQVEDVANPTKDAKTKRIKFYCGLALTNKKAAAVMIGVSHATL